MNKEIQKMYEQSFGNGTDGFYGFDKDKFAKLIVDKCIELVSNQCEKIKPEKSDFSIGYLRCGIDSVNAMKSMVNIGCLKIENKKSINNDWLNDKNYNDGIEP